MLNLVINTLLIMLGLAMLYYGSNLMVNGSVNIARKLRVSQLVIGLTIVAFGTSTPELVVGIVSALEGKSEILLGNVIGSNIVNIGLIIGFSAVMFPLIVQRSIIKKQVPIMIGVAFLLFPLSMDGEISQIEGIILVGGSIAFTIFSYAQSRKEISHKPKQQESSKNAKGSSVKAIFFIAIGITLLTIGAIVTVDNAVILAEILGVSERIIGLTIIAIGTNLPELFTAIVAVKRGNVDISIGNIIGSNIYNILVIVGISSAIVATKVASSIFSDYIVMILFSLVLLPLMRTGFVISKYEGFALMGGYFTFLVILLFVG